MAKIEGFRIRNFGPLHDITMGNALSKREGALTPMTVVIGKNGAGKSMLFDAFGFLADCLKLGVEEACDKRNGFERIVSQGIKESIEFEICYREENDPLLPIEYIVSFDLDDQHRPYIKYERLFDAKESFILRLEDGRGVVRKDYKSKEESVELEDNRKLGIATLGALKQYPRISAFRKFIEGWYLSYFTPDAARGLPLAGPQKHLNIHGDNLGNVVQFMQRDHPEKFQGILNDIAGKIPGINTISTETTSDGRLLLKFNDKGFKDPFLAQQMSDGTLKVFAYLLMLSDPNPPPFICIEEPENGLYHKLLETLARQFRAHVSDGKNKTQIFITTHQPYLVDALAPNEVWILEKGEDGFSKIRRASEDPLVQALVEEGLPLGGLWYSDYLEGDSDGAL